MSNKFDIFTNKYADTQLSAFRQKKIQKLLKKGFFKAVIFNKVVFLEKVLNSKQVFNFYFDDDIKNPHTNKVNEKSCQVMYYYNNEKKNLVLMHLPKILKVCQNISLCFTVMIKNNDNNNIRFYLRDIIQAYCNIVIFRPCST